MRRTSPWPEAVTKSVTPKGVEHSPTSTRVGHHLFVTKSVTPKGVEHSAPNSAQSVATAVTKSVTPKGVEHEEGGLGAWFSHA